MLALIERERCVPFGEAVRLARKMLCEPLPREVAPPPRQPKSMCRRNTQAMAERVWHEAVPARGEPVERYLASRGLRLPEPRDDPGALRDYLACPRGPAWLPAMVALMTCPLRNVPTGVHRTFRLEEGTDRLRDERGKAMLGRARVIRLSPNDAVTLELGRCYALVTLLAVIQHLDWWPVWVAASARGVADLTVLPWVDTVTIVADRDWVGQRAAETCRRRLVEAGREVLIATPLQGDWADRVGRAAWTARSDLKSASAPQSERSSGLLRPTRCASSTLATRGPFLICNM